MTRPKAPKARQQGAAAGATGAQPAGEEAEQQQQQQQQQTAAKKRPEAAGGAAAAAGGGSEQLEVDQLERKRMQVADELRQVERQVCRQLVDVSKAPRGRVRPLGLRANSRCRRHATLAAPPSTHLHPPHPPPSSADI